MGQFSETFLELRMAMTFIFWTPNFMDNLSWKTISILS